MSCGPFESIVVSKSAKYQPTSARLLVGHAAAFTPQRLGLWNDGGTRTSLTGTSARGWHHTVGRPWSKLLPGLAGSQLFGRLVHPVGGQGTPHGCWVLMST